MKDESLRKEMVNYIPNSIKCAFENDILKSTHDFVVGIIDRGLNNFKIEIDKYFIGLSSSNFKDYSPVYTTLYDSLKTRQNRFDFLNLIDSTNETRIAKIAFGKLLISEYSQKQPTETEALTFNNINELEQQLLKDEELAKQKAEAERLKQDELTKQREDRIRQNKEKK